MAFGIDDILGAGLQIINKVIPDPQARAQAEVEMFKLRQAGEFEALNQQIQLASIQTDINKAEASNPSMFISGWRPAAGWVCVMGLMIEFIVRPIAQAYGFAIPSLSDVLVELLFGMLGLGGLRTAEKLKGVSR